MTAITLDVARDTEIHVDARIRITTKPEAAAGPLVRLTTKCGGITFTQTEGQHMAYTLPGDKQVQLSIAYVDANNNPASVDGAVTWESSNPDVADVEPMSDAPGGPAGGVVMLVPGTGIGATQITARADADLGAGMRELVTLLDVNVVGGEAVAGVITPGEAQPKP